MARNTKNSRKKSSLGVSFWIVFIVFIGLLYIVSRPSIEQVLRTTRFLDYLTQRPEEPREQEEQPVRTEEPPAREPAPRPTPERPGEQPPARPDPLPAPPVVQDPPPRLPEQPPPAPKPPAVARPSAAQTRQTVLHFMTIDASGTPVLKPVVRQIPRSETPLSTTIEALIKGPTEQERAAGLTSLIPSDSRLLSASVRDGTAFVNFNENFRINSYGREGYLVQLRQTVYTLTEFPTVQRVQILIEGRQVDYLAPEGFFIGRPLDRSTPGL